MLIVNKKNFINGSMLMISFILLFIVIIMPIFPGLDGGKTTGLDYADNMFNSLSKGSSDFFESVEVKVEESKNTKIEYSVSVALPEGSPYTIDEIMTTMVQIVEKSGSSARLDLRELHVDGNLGAILGDAVTLSKHLYDNDAEAVSAAYNGADPFLVSYSWWHFLKPSIKELQKQGNIQEAKAVDMVMRRALETGYNFYGVAATKVSDEFLLMAAVLIFYVVYTMWYGFAIFHMFDGIGLTMSKAKPK